MRQPILDLYQNAARFDAIANEVDDDIPWWQSRFFRPAILLIWLRYRANQPRPGRIRASRKRYRYGSGDAAAARGKEHASDCTWIEGDFLRMKELPVDSFDAASWPITP